MADSWSSRYFKWFSWMRVDALTKCVRVGQRSMRGGVELHAGAIDGVDVIVLAIAYLQKSDWST